MKKIAIVLIGLMFSIQSYCDYSKNEIQKINNSLIYDLFMNYELTVKNGNLSTVVDFFPCMNNVNFKNIRLTTNVGGTNQVCNFILNKNEAIDKLSYEVNDKIFQYDFIYEGSKLTSINISGKPKISFGYNKNGLLSTITRAKGSDAFEYNFNYLEGQNKSNIKLIVVQGEKRSPSSREFYATWNTQFKLEAYSFDIYDCKNLKYSPKEELLNFSFTTVNDDNNNAKWVYSTMDDKQNWTERKYKDVTFNRVIDYN